MFFTNLFESNLRIKNFAQKIIYYNQTESTTNDLWKLYNENQNNQLFIITDNQTNGKGRQDKTWESQPSKSITCSFILQNIFKKKFSNLYSILIPIAIIKGIKKFLFIDAKIKWPNDIIYNNKKIGGILIESKINNKNPVFNIGIGLNVNENQEDFSKELQNIAISLKMIVGYSIQREPLLAEIFNELNKLTRNLDNERLIDLWMKNCNHINKTVQFNKNDEKISGTFKGINNTGQALIEIHNQIIHYNQPITII